MNSEEFAKAYEFVKNGGALSSHMRRLVDEPMRISMMQGQAAGKRALEQLVDDLRKQLDTKRTFFSFPSSNLTDQVKLFEWVNFDNLKDKDFALSRDDFDRQMYGAFDIGAIAQADPLPDAGHFFVMGRAQYNHLLSALNTTADDTPKDLEKTKHVYVEPDGTQNAGYESRMQNNDEVCPTCGSYWGCDHG